MFGSSKSSVSKTTKIDGSQNGVGAQGDGIAIGRDGSATFGSPINFSESAQIPWVKLALLAGGSLLAWKAISKFRGRQ